MLYLDHSASTPMDKEAIAVMHETMDRCYANASSLHPAGLEAEKLVERAREVAAHLLSVSPAQVIFTSGGTESNNLAIKGAAYRYRNRGRHLVTVQTEHPSVLNVFQQLEAEGYEVTYLPVDNEGQIDLSELEEAITDQTIIVSVMQANNETGALQPTQEIGEVIKRRNSRCLYHVDAVQCPGRLPVSMLQGQIDLMSLSGHKFGGPKGTGLLIRAPKLELAPLLHGGSQEYGLRPGTENVPAIVGMVKALRIALERQPAAFDNLHRIRLQLMDALRGYPDLALNSPTLPEHAAPHIVNFSVPGMKAEVLLRGLAQYDVYVSSRSACSSKTERPSNVLTAMGRDRAHATSSIRVSFSPKQSESAADEFLRAFTRVWEQLGLPLKTETGGRHR